MSALPSPEGHALNDPFAAFVMTEFHEPAVEQIVRAEELGAVPGQVECPGPHSASMTRFVFGPRAGTVEAAPLDGPCPLCGASV